MEKRKMQTQAVNTYIHRRQDGTVRVAGTDPVCRPGMAGAASRLRAYWKGGEEGCLGK